METQKWTDKNARIHISPTRDIFVRYLLASPKNTDITKAFINAVLEDSGQQPVKSVKITSPFYPHGDPQIYHILELDRSENNAEAVCDINGTGRQKKLSAALFGWLRFFSEGAQEDFMEKYGGTDGLAEGLVEGRAEGAGETVLANARSFRRLGVSDEIIAEATGLSKDEIAAL